MNTAAGTNGYRPVVDRIEADLRRIDEGDTPAPFIANALRTIAQAQDDFRREVMGEIGEMRGDVTTVKRTMFVVLVAMLPFTGALIYFGQQAAP